MEYLSSNPVERRTQTLTKVMDLLHALELQTRVSTDATFQERRIQGLRNQIPVEMRRVLDKYLEFTDLRLRKRYAPEKAAEITQGIRRKRTRDVHAENLYDSILSTPDHPIHAKGYGISLLQRYLGTMAIDKAPPAVFETYGWMSLDMNGAKGMIDCTTYQNVTHYLQAVAQFLLDEEGKTRLWLRDQKIKVTPLTAGGDEFALLLDAEGPMSKEFFQEAGMRLQQELGSRPELRRFLDFNNRNVQLEFKMPTEAQRAAFFKMNRDEQDAFLGNVRETLPDEFIPTWGVGGANLKQGALRAVERGSLSLRLGRETFDSGRLKIVGDTIALAEALQSENKAKVKAELKETNPKMHSFLMRNGENRHLEEKLRHTEAQLNQTMEALAGLERGNQELQDQLTSLTTQMADLTARYEEILSRGDTY